MLKQHPRQHGNIGVLLNFTALTEFSVTSLPEYEINIVVDERGVSTSSTRKEVCVCEVEMQDGRSMSCTLDKEGFCLIGHRYNHINYYCNKEVVEKYYPELESRIKSEIPNASKVVVFAHQVRSWRKDIQDMSVSSGSLAPKGPVQFCHTDFSIQGAISRLKSMAVDPDEVTGGTGNGTPNPGGRCGSDIPPPGPLRRVLTRQQVDEYLNGRRFIILHAWRNIVEDALQWHPLGLCCADTVEDADLLAYDLTYTQASSDTPTGRLSCMMVRHNSRQKWVSYPAMCRDELLLFKQFDSHADFTRKHGLTSPCERLPGELWDDDTPGKFISCFAPHSAFDNTNGASTTDTDTAHPPVGRESIEAGVIVLLD